MHLIAPLISGIRGAENGTVGIFKRATGTRATYYVDFEATQAITPTTDLALDANGQIEVYVNELVDVVVKSSGGTTLRTFTAGYAIPNIEVISAAHTGADYITAATGVLKPKTLQAAMDSWLVTGGGAPDWKVLIGGTPTPLKDAITGQFVYNVKDYDAVGDGVTDDKVAIQAALDAIPAAGGWLYFPAGTYRITSQLTMYSTVNLIGDGQNLSKISIDHATANTMASTQTEDGPRYIMNLHFEPLQANTGTILSWSTTSHRVVMGCTFGSTLALVKGTCIATSGAAGTSWKVSDCKFVLGLNGKAFSATNTHIRDCQFSMTAGAHTGTVITLAGNGTRQTSGYVTDCEFDVSGPTASTFDVIDMGANPRGSVTGCTFSDVGAGSTVTAIKLGTLTSCWFHESGNSFFPAPNSPNEPINALKPYSYTTPAYNATSLVELSSRTLLQRAVSQAGGGTKTLESDLYGTILLRVGDSTAFTLQATPAHIGARLIIAVENTTGLTTGNITPGSNFRSVGVFTVIANSFRLMEYVCLQDIPGTAVKWFALSDLMTAI